MNEFSYVLSFKNKMQQKHKKKFLRKMQSNSYSFVMVGIFDSFFILITSLGECESLIPYGKKFWYFHAPHCGNFYFTKNVLFFSNIPQLRIYEHTAIIRQPPEGNYMKCLNFNFIGSTSSGFFLRKKKSSAYSPYYVLQRTFIRLPYTLQHV